MAKLWQFRHYSVYRNLLIYFVLLVAMAVIIVSSALYLFFTAKTEKEISSNVISMLDQTSYTSSIVRDQILTIGNQMLNNHGIMAVLLNKRSDPIDERDAMYYLRDIESVFPIIKYIGIYNDKTQRYLNTAGPPYTASESLRKQLTGGTNDAQYIEFFPQKLTTESSETTTEHVLTFILRPNYSITSTYKGGGAIVIHVDEDYIQQTIRSIGSKSEDVFVMDQEGFILSHTDSAQFMRDFSDKSHIQRILGSDESSGHFLASVDGRRQLVTYVKSSQLQWYFVSVRPYSLLISDISELRNFTWAIALAMILVGVLLAYFATNRIYNPLGQLLAKVQDVTGISPSNPKRSSDEYALLLEAFSNVVDQASVMEMEMKHSFHVIKKTYLDHAMKGTLQDFRDTHAIHDDIRRQFQGPYYIVILAKIDRYAELAGKHSRQQLGAFRFSVCNISQELLQKHATNDPLVVGEDTVAILAQSKSAEGPAHTVLTLREIQNVIRTYFGFTVTFSVGDPVSDQNRIHQSFQSAQEYAKYRLFYGHESIIQSELVRERQGREDRYPTATEKKLLEALRLNHPDKVDRALAQFIKEISKMTYYQTLSYANQLLITVLKEFDGTLNIMQERSKECYSIINRLQDQETLPEISALIHEFCKVIACLLEKKNVTKHKDVIDAVCQYLKEHYDEPDLGVETMAEKVHLTPGYLGKLFRNHAQVSFNEYLKNLRLEKAQDLLVQTDDPVTVISEKVGILNTNYFYALFKKTYGISPAVYREHAADRSRGVGGPDGLMQK